MKITTDELLTLKLNGVTNQQIANKYGMTKSQISRRTNSQSFKVLLKAKRQEATDDVITRVANEANTAFTQLVELSKNAQSENVRYNAICKILDMFYEHIELADLASDIQELKQANDID